MFRRMEGRAVDAASKLKKGSVRSTVLYLMQEGMWAGKGQNKNEKMQNE